MHIQLPHTSARLHAHLGKRGMGMGSVLLSKGGTGGASSYRDLEDYIHITGKDPRKAQPIGGSGFIPEKARKLDRLGAKLSNLAIHTPVSTGAKPKIKNITMSI